MIQFDSHRPTLFNLTSLWVQTLADLFRVVAIWSGQLNISIRNQFQVNVIFYSSLQTCVRPGCEWCVHILYAISHFYPTHRSIWLRKQIGQALSKLIWHTGASILGVLGGRDFIDFGVEGRGGHRGSWWSWNINIWYNVPEYDIETPLKRAK